MKTQYQQILDHIQQTLAVHVANADQRGFEVSFKEEAGVSEAAPADGFARKEPNGTFLLKISIGPFHTVCRDTDGDGDCGQRFCPHCGKDAHERGYIEGKAAQRKLTRLQLGLEEQE